MNALQYIVTSICSDSRPQRLEMVAGQTLFRTVDMKLTYMVGNFIFSFVTGPLSAIMKRGDMSSRDMSGLMIHHSRNYRA